jgi:hypothetical protein
MFFCAYWVLSAGIKLLLRAPGAAPIQPRVHPSNLRDPIKREPGFQAWLWDMQLPFLNVRDSSGETANHDQTLGPCMTACRYSPYFSSTLILAFGVLTSSLLIAFDFVGQVADCARPESRCLYNAKRWILEHLIAGTAGASSVDAAAELTAACNAGSGSGMQLNSTSVPSPYGNLTSSGPGVCSLMCDGCIWESRY